MEDDEDTLDIGLIHILQLNERAGISKKEAADIIGVSVGLFDKLMQSGQMPKPVKLGRRNVWNRSEVEAAFSRLCNLNSAVSDSSWDEVIK